MEYISFLKLFILFKGLLKVMEHASNDSSWIITLDEFRNIIAVVSDQGGAHESIIKSQERICYWILDVYESLKVQ